MRVRFPPSALILKTYISILDIVECLPANYFAYFLPIPDPASPRIHHNYSAHLGDTGHLISGRPAGLSEKIKKTKPIRRNKSPEPNDGAMRAEYDFSKGVRGKHAAQYAAGTNVVVIEPDVAAEFPTAEDVNETLRAVAQLFQCRKRSISRKTA